jgi:hypothetical protein|tara:strand:+ start:1538 stop:1720 length:183 start_codon:yes stop_codon:yes gene_type:complete
MTKNDKKRDERVTMKKTKTDNGRPEAGKIYTLIGGTGTPSIAAGNTWAESERTPVEKKNN